MRIYADLARVRMALTRCPRALQGTNGRHLGIPPNGRRCVGDRLTATDRATLDDAAFSDMARDNWLRDPVLRGLRAS